MEDLNNDVVAQRSAAMKKSVLELDMVKQTKICLDLTSVSVNIPVSALNDTQHESSIASEGERSKCLTRVFPAP